MGQNKEGWLPHLPNEVVDDARGWNLDAYVVALEGWRRGLTLRWHTKESGLFNEMRTWFVDTPGRLFSLSSDKKTHYFFRTRGDKVTNEAVDIGGDKEKTKHMLKKANISMPEGKRFDETASEESIIAYAKEIKFPVVLKPVDGSFGRGVVTNIENESDLRDALTHARTKENYNNIIIEQYIPGDDYRVYVVDDQAVAAMKRVPANVIGDGKMTIKELIELKNEERQLNPRLVSCQIPVDQEVTDFIERQGYSLDSVLEEDKQLFLMNKSNISLGGDPISMTSEIHEEIKDTAVRAIQSVPGLAHGAVDLIVDSRKPITEAATVIELNPTSQLGGLLFPVEGQASDVPAAIIDYYFPETKNIETDKTKMYFDFIDVLSPLVSKSAHTSTVSPMPMGEIFAKKYTVIGDVQDLGFHMGLRKQAFERYLSGLVMNQSNGNIEVVVSGTDPEMVDDFRNGLWEDPERSEVLEVHESSWDGPMKIGFEIRGDLKLQAEEIEEIKQKIEQTEEELIAAERKQKKLYESLSWRLSAPIRWFGAIVKSFREPNL